MIGGSASGSYSKSSGISSTRYSLPQWSKGTRNALLSDVARLHGANPYAGNDLGFGQETLSLMPGGARDMAAGAVEAGTQGINDTFAGPGGPGTGSFAHKAALSGLRSSYAASVADATREAALADAAQRRQDYAMRIGAGQNVLNTAAGLATVSRRSVNRQASGSAGVSV